MKPTTTTHSLLLSLALGVCAFITGCAADSQDTDAVESEGANANESAQTSTRPTPAPATGRIGSHGMVIAGKPGAAFLSHIPMFMAPHDVQLVVAGSFTILDGGGAGTTTTATLPASFSDASFTFLPDRMSLDALRTGALAELRGTIFVGNFEQGGRPIPSRVRFTVTSVVHQHILSTQGSATTPAQPELDYILFGSRESTFAVHRIATAPSFDEVLHVVVQGPNAPSDVDLAHGVDAHIANTSDLVTNRAGETSSAITAKAGTQTFTMKSSRTLSCLIGPDFSSACP